MHSSVMGAAKLSVAELCLFKTINRINSRTNSENSALIIDFHTHVLPCIDDGSRNVETSLAMLKASADQGVQVMVATPHFYATRDRVEGFLNRRAESLSTLQPLLSDDLPQIKLGAEVAFFRGISEADRIEKLRIEGTDCLLLEMPFRRWTEEDLDEVSFLIRDRNMTIILAHIERYMGIWENGPFIRRIQELPVIAQINAESLLDWRQRGKLIKMVKSGEVKLLGSDCHGMNHRPPNIKAGRDVLLRKAGPEAVDRIDNISQRLLGL